MAHTTSCCCATPSPAGRRRTSPTTTARSRRGRSAATAVVEHLTASRAIPDLVLCSSARRTVETLERIGECLRPDTAVEVDDRLYGAGCGTLLARARQFPEAVGTAMFIGHNPGIEDLAALLAGDGDPTSLDEMGAKFPTAAIAHLRIDPRGVSWLQEAPSSSSSGRPGSATRLSR